MMKKNNLPDFSRWLLLPLVAVAFMLGAISIVMNSSAQNALANAGSGEKIVMGEVKNIILVQTSGGTIVKILELENGKKYRLPQGITQGIGKGFNIELVVPVKLKPIEDEVSTIHPSAIPVISVKVTAIPIPGSSNKLVYPPGNSPAQ